MGVIGQVGQAFALRFEQGVILGRAVRPAHQGVPEGRVLPDAVQILQRVDTIVADIIQLAAR